MSFLSYNGVVIQLTKTNQFTQEVERSRDKADVIGTRYRIDATGVFNPAATSYSQGTTGFPPMPYGPPFVRPGQSPADTVVALKSVLNTNRAKLVYALGTKRDAGGNLVNNVILQSPIGDAPYDAAGGPEVLGVAITPMGDSKLFLVRIIIETILDDCSVNTGQVSPDPIASNRWETTHQVDDQQYTTIMTRGLAAFRMDTLAVMELSCDSLRDACLPAIPFGFRRVHLNASADSRGRFLTYETIDREQSKSLGSTFNPDKVVTPALLGVLDFKATVVSGVGPYRRADGGGGIAGPLNTSAIAIDVVGGGRASRANLVQFAIRLAIERLGINPGIPNIANGEGIVQSVSIGESTDDQKVSLRVECWRTIGGQGQNVNPLGVGGIWQKFVGIDALPLTFPDDANSGLPGGLSPSLPNDSNTRGAWNGTIIAQLLQNSCDEKFLNNNCSMNKGKAQDNYVCTPTIYSSVTPQGVPIPPNPSLIRKLQNKVLTNWSVKKSIKSRVGKKVGLYSSRKSPGSFSSSTDAGGGGTGSGGSSPGGSSPITQGEPGPTNGSGGDAVGGNASGGSGVNLPTGGNDTFWGGGGEGPLFPGGGDTGTGGDGSGAGDGSGGGMQASGVPGVEILTLCIPSTLVCVEWTAECLGAKPDLPSPVDPTGSLVLLEEQVEPSAVEVCVDGQTPIFRVSGRFDFVSVQAIDFSQASIFMGCSPYAGISSIVATLTPDDQDQTILFGDGSDVA